MSAESEQNIDVSGLPAQQQSSTGSQEGPGYSGRSFFWKAASIVPIPVFIYWCLLLCLMLVAGRASRDEPRQMMRDARQYFLLYTYALYSSVALVSCACSFLSFARKEENARLSLYAAVPWVILALIFFGLWRGVIQKWVEFLFNR